MSDNTEQLQVDVVSCSVCQQAIPHTEGLSVEAHEYLFFFCGSGCYSSWQQVNGASLVNGG